MPTAIGVAIHEQRDAASAALDARSFARECGVDRIEQLRLATVVAELAGNIVKYAGSGRIQVAARRVDGRRCVDIVASDRGPGIASIEDALRDHESTGGSLGLGLPGVRRLSHEFEISSSSTTGTVVRVRRWIEQP